MSRAFYTLQGLQIYTPSLFVRWPSGGSPSQVGQAGLVSPRTSFPGGLLCITGLALRARGAECSTSTRPGMFSLSSLCIRALPVTTAMPQILLKYMGSTTLPPHRWCEPSVLIWRNPKITLGHLHLRIWQLQIQSLWVGNIPKAATISDV